MDSNSRMRPSAGKATEHRGGQRAMAPLIDEETKATGSDASEALDAVGRLIDNKFFED